MLRPVVWSSARLASPLARQLRRSAQGLAPVHLRPLHLAPALRGPGADYKYKSEEERAAADQAARVARRRRLLGAGLAGGAAVGFLWANIDYWRPRERASEVGTESGAREFLLAEPPPTFPVARSILNPGDRTGLKITLFQYQTCPFCCKARVFLDYFGFSYDVVEVNSVLRQQVKWSKYKKVPILVATSGDQVIQVNDSSVIVSALYSLLADSRGMGLDKVMDCYPTLRYRDPDGKEVSEIQNKYFLMFNDTKVARTKEDIVAERKWRKWVDDKLVHMLSPNVYRTPSEALEAFRWFSVAGDWEQHFSWWERELVIYLGAAVMFLLGKRLKKKYKLQEDVRESLYQECEVWVAAVERRGGLYLGGAAPNLADLAVYGVLNAIEGCEAFQDARRHTRVGEWFDRMKVVVTAREGRAMVEA